MAWWFNTAKKPAEEKEPVVHPSAIRQRSEPARAEQAQVIPQPPHIQDPSFYEAENANDELDQNEDEDPDDDTDEPTSFPVFQVPNKNVIYPGTEAATKLAMSIGCATPEQVYAKLTNFFQQEQIAIAKSEDVVDWLTDNMNEDEGWYWRPLRSFDMMNEQAWGHKDFDSAQWTSRLYDLPIPSRVLKRVAKMIAEFGTNIRFFVSDFADCDYDALRKDDRGDIFIMVFPANFSPDCDDEDEDFFYVFDTWRKPCYEDNAQQGAA